MGDFLGGRYRLLEQIGRGSVGTVHRARDEFLGRDVAIKLIEPPVASADDLRRDEDEVKLLARLNHHGLITLFDDGSDVSDAEQPRIYLVMELIEGPDLRDRLAQGPMPPLDVGQIGYDMAKALGYIHDHGVIHRDVKPANIMMFDYRNDAARVRAKLTDFGIAVMMEEPLARGGTFVGTAAYVSPEQAKGEKLGPPSDVYSLGLVLLECLTGVKAYPGDPLPSALARLLQVPDVPVDLDPQWVQLLTAMTATDRAARPSARDVAITLDEITVAEKGRQTGDLTAFPRDEAGRSEAVYCYQILDTPQDGAFDRITALAARLFMVPIAIVSVIDHDPSGSSPTTALKSTTSTGNQAYARRPFSKMSRGSSRMRERTREPCPTPSWPANSVFSSTRVFHCVPVTATTWAPCALLTANRAP